MSYHPPKRPARPGTLFGMATRSGLVHRIRNNDPLLVTWMCGSSALIFGLVKDPDEFGGVCDRCDAVFFGGVVYRCYSADDRLLYIGSCVIWAHREGSHRKYTPWWAEVARVDREPHPNPGAARRAERAAIRGEAPLYNKQHNIKRFKMVGHVYVPLEMAA